MRGGDMCESQTKLNFIKGERYYSGINGVAKYYIFKNIDCKPSKINGEYINQYVFKKEELNPDEQTQITKLNEEIEKINSQIILKGVTTSTKFLLTEKKSKATEKIENIWYVKRSLDNKIDTEFLEGLEQISPNTSTEPLLEKSVE
jgi:hypothetical protein